MPETRRQVFYEILWEFNQFVMNRNLGYKIIPKMSHGTFDEYMDLNGFIESDMTQEQVGYYYSFNWSNMEPGLMMRNQRRMITETLKSYSTETVCKKIVDKLSDYIQGCAINEWNSSKENSFFNLYVPSRNPFVDFTSIDNNLLKDSDQSYVLYRILKECNYYITNVAFDRNGLNFVIQIESMYTDDVTDIVQEEYDGVLYHITRKSNIESIMRTGLRPKVGKTVIHGGYRYFPERVYFIIPELLEKTEQEMIDEIRELLNIKESDCVVLKINLRGYENISLYDDTADGIYACYTYTAIPPKFITEIIEL